eukprot:9658704-Alexandrium_andersonii.AAC.1
MCIRDSSGAFSLWLKAPESIQKRPRQPERGQQGAHNYVSAVSGGIELPDSALGIRLYAFAPAR